MDNDREDGCSDLYQVSSLEALANSEKVEDNLPVESSVGRQRVTKYLNDGN